MYVCTVEHCTEWSKCMSAQWSTVQGGLNVCLHSGAPYGVVKMYVCTVEHCTEWSNCMSAQWSTVQHGINVCLHGGALYRVV